MTRIACQGLGREGKETVEKAANNAVLFKIKVPDSGIIYTVMTVHVLTLVWWWTWTNLPQLCNMCKFSSSGGRSGSGAYADFPLMMRHITNFPLVLGHLLTFLL